MHKLFGSDFAKVIPYGIIGLPCRPRYRNSCFILYPFAQLNELIALVCTKPLDDDEALYKIRFVMDCHYQVWFAKEGTPCATIPGHGQMLEGHTCITAGVLRFSKDFKTLEIDHKSGDYRPAFDSLKWFLAALMVNFEARKIQLPATLSILRLNSAGASKNQSILALEDIVKWAQELSSFPIKMLAQQAIEKKVIQHSLNNTPNASPSSLASLFISASSSAAVTEIKPAQNQMPSPGLSP